MQKMKKMKKKPKNTNIKRNFFETTILDSKSEV
jgi:hypothetical protein